MNTPIRPIVTRPAPVLAPIKVRVPTPTEVRLKALLQHNARWGHARTVCEAVGIWPA